MRNRSLQLSDSHNGRVSSIPSTVEALLERKLASLHPSLAVVLGDRRIGPARANVTIVTKELGTLLHIATGQIGHVAQDYAEGRLEFEGSVRELMAIAAQLIDIDPTRSRIVAGPLAWYRDLARRLRSRIRHSGAHDARNVQFHYDVSDEFYALWLDPRRVYSCAYYRDRDMSLARAQEAKLDLICRKLALRQGERFLDVGAGWGALLLWAAEHYGVRAHGITLSVNQHAHTQQLIEQSGLSGRVSVELCDYRELREDEPFDKIASVGMFEHVGLAQLPRYFAKLTRLLRPGGLLMNHGITAAGTRNGAIGAGIGDFCQHHVFPGGELVHVSHALKEMAEAGLEVVDVENLRPHYARTLWAWSDALEARLGAARALTRDAVVRTYRLYLAGSAMCFERGWLSLHQILAARTTGDVGSGTMRGAQSDYPFNRGHVYR